MDQHDDGRTRFRYVEAGDLNNDTVGFKGLQVRSTTADEKLGTVRGFIVDEQSSQLHYVVVDSGGWFSSESFLIPPAYTRVDAEQQVLWAEATRDTIRKFPPFDPREYPALSDTQLWEMERHIIQAYGDDPGAVAPSANWDRQSWAQYRQPDWWRTRGTARPVTAGSDAGRVATHGTLTTHDPVTTAGAAGAGAAGAIGGVGTGRAEHERRYDSRLEAGAGELAGTAQDRARLDPARPERRPVADVPADRTAATAWPDPATERAQPGDVLGIERGGETTSLGETAEDEDKRRAAAEKDFDQVREREEREPGRRRPRD